MNPVKIYASFSQTFDKKPLVVLHDPLCGNCSAHTPKQLRAIASALMKIADDAFDYPVNKRTVSRAYDVKA